MVDQTPKEAFNAINNVRGRWSGEIEGSTVKLNDEALIVVSHDEYFLKQINVEHSIVME